jgi:hypothetical protein
VKLEPLDTGIRCCHETAEHGCSSVVGVSFQFGHNLEDRSHVFLGADTLDRSSGDGCSDRRRRPEATSSRNLIGQSDVHRSFNSRQHSPVDHVAGFQANGRSVLGQGHRVGYLCGRGATKLKREGNDIESRSEVARRGGGRG